MHPSHWLICAQVGANGCGKTTVIECLKFGTTGQAPPGSASGKAFVHDPKVTGVSEVKAQLKLRFKNYGGQRMVVVRSMQLTQKKTTATFKQLDGVIRATKPDGSKTSYTHKCGELDKTVPIMIGVSRAVLESVIFCHQEDSSWPLQEGPRRRPNAVRTGSLKDQRPPVASSPGDASTQWRGVTRRAPQARSSRSVLMIYLTARATRRRDAVLGMTLNVPRSRRWCQRDVASPRRRRRGATPSMRPRESPRLARGVSRRRRSTQALDVLNKQKKGLASKAKDISGDLKGLHADKVAAQDHLKRKASAEKAIESADAQIKACDDKQASLRDEKARITDKMRKLQQQEQGLQACRAEVDGLERSLRYLEERLADSALMDEDDEVLAATAASCVENYSRLAISAPFP